VTQQEARGRSFCFLFMLFFVTGAWIIDNKVLQGDSSLAALLYA
jgi:hypothetical protein